MKNVVIMKIFMKKAVIMRIFMKIFMKDAVIMKIVMKNVIHNYKRL